MISKLADKFPSKLIVSFRSIQLLMSMLKLNVLKILGMRNISICQLKWPATWTLIYFQLCNITVPNYPMIIGYRTIMSQTMVLLYYYVIDFIPEGCVRWNERCR